MDSDVKQTFVAMDCAICSALGESIKTEAEMVERHRIFRLQQALHLLKMAREIRANADLMAGLRVYIRETRDELAEVLDE